jgi:hypothetical protein
MRTVLSVPLAAAVLGAACGGSHAAENARAKARIFAPAADFPVPAPRPIDIKTLERSPATQDAVLGMSETELRERVGSFRLRAKLRLSFSGSGRTVTVDEDRLVEQSRTGDLHLRILDANGGGMEILFVAGKLYGRSRYGPFVLRDRQSGLAQQREEAAGALATLYALSDRGLSFHELGAGQGCARFAIGAGPARPEAAPPRFVGRLDADTLKRFQFVYDRRVTEIGGELCVNPQGIVTEARVSMRWSAAGDAGSGETHAELEESLSDLGGDVRVDVPEHLEPEPHRPRGPFDTLDRFGFVQHLDGGEE